MSAESAIQTATLLQQKVGNSLSGVTNLLAPPERSDSMLNAGAASLPTLVLDEVKELQKKTIESVDKVAQVLQSQLDLAQEAERRARDQAAELRKENQISGVTPGGLTDMTGDDAGMFGLTGDKLKNLLTLGLGSVFTVSALKTAFKTLGKRLLKGGAIASMVALIADPVIDYIDNQFELDLDDATKKDIKLSLVGAGMGFALAGIQGAIVGGTLPYISRVGEYIAGTLNANEVKDSDFAMTALGGGLAAAFTAGKVGALLKLSTLPKVATFGAALASVPVMIGIGAAVALGVGVTYIAKKVDEYQEKMLDTLADRMVDLDKEMGEFAAKQEEGLFERMGIQLGNLSALGQARVASEEAFEQFGQDKEKFMADTSSQTTLKALADTITGYSDTALQDIMLDRTKSTNFFKTIESLKAIAAKGGFGKDSEMIFEKLAAFSDRIQNVAIAQVQAGEKGGVTTLVADNRFGTSQDQLEKVGMNQDKIAQLEQEKREKISELAQAKLDLEDAQTRNTGKFFDTKEVNDLQKKIGDLEKEIGTEDKKGKIDKEIEILNRQIETLVKKGGTNFLFTFKDLEELYKDNPEELSEIIKRSINQQGANFLGAQKQANDLDTTKLKGPDVIVQDNSTKTQNNNAQAYNYVSRLDVNGDPYFVREGYSYGL